MKILAGIFFILVSFNSSAQVLTPKEREDMIASTIYSCFENQRAAAMNRSVSDDQLRRYCSCYARELITRDMTQEIVARAFEAALNGSEEEMLRILSNGKNLAEILNRCVGEALEL